MRNLQNHQKPDFPKLQVIPQPDGIDFLANETQQARYQFGLNLPKPFIHPLRGPSGVDLTRYGHPNPQSNHDHHRSIWFGHQFIRPLGKTPDKIEPTPTAEWNFWEEPKPSSDVKIRHSRILALQDGNDFAATAVEAHWWAGGHILLNQTTIYAYVPIDDHTHALDVQFELSSPGSLMVELGKSNFGLMGVRVAKTISEQFGGGRLRNSQGATGEPSIFAKTARWVDYSGPTGPNRTEGICYMDHPSNPRHPTAWHVRRDGWMIAAFTLAESWTLASGHPLKLRYRLLAHQHDGNVDQLQNAWEHFASSPPYLLESPKGANPSIKKIHPQS